MNFNDQKKNYLIDHHHLSNHSKKLFIHLFEEDDEEKEINSLINDVSNTMQTFE